MKTMATTLILAVLVLGAGCGGREDGTGVVQLAAGATMDAGSPRLEDLPVPNSLELAVKEINIHVAAPDDDERDEDIGRPSGEAPEALEDGGWVTVASERRLTLFPDKNRLVLGSAIVPVGQLTQIRLLLDRDPVLWNGTEHLQVACPSCTASGLKLILDEHVELPANGFVELTLMFDLSMTAIESANGSKLGPVIHVELTQQP
jgi:hypothetical protein